MITKLIQLYSGGWVDPNKVSSVYIGWKFKHPSDLPRVEVVVDGVRLIAIDATDDLDLDQCKIQRDLLADKINALRESNEYSNKTNMLIADRPLPL